MAEELNEEAGGEKKSSLMGTIILLVIALLVPALLGLGLYMVVLKPKLTMETTAAATPTDDIPPFPETMQTVVFDETHVTVQTEDPDLAAPLLIMQVALSCADGPTSALIDSKKEYFAAEILSVHQGRTRAELNDPLVQNSILEQIRQRSNILLKRLSPKMEMTVLKAMYLKFAIMDLG